MESIRLRPCVIIDFCSSLTMYLQYTRVNLFKVFDNLERRDMLLNAHVKQNSQYIYTIVIIK